MQILTSFIVASFILTHIVIIINNISSIIFSLIFYIHGSSQEENRKQNRNNSLLCDLHSAQFHINKAGLEKGNLEITWLTGDLVKGRWKHFSSSNLSLWRWVYSSVLYIFLPSTRKQFFPYESGCFVSP